MTREHDAVSDVRDRMQRAATNLDAIRGDTVASDWLAERMRGLMRSDDAGSVAHLTDLAIALEIPDPPEAVA